VEHKIGALGRLVDRVGVPEIRADSCRVRHGDRVVDGDDRAVVSEAAGDGEAGRVTDVIAVGLERGTEHGDAPAGQVATDGLAREVDDPFAAAQVDGVYGGEQVHQRGDAPLGGGGTEGADVLGEAAAAEAEAGGEELTANPLVDADRVCELNHIATSGFAHLSHYVNEGDLGREE
jgi:hypothetical protein